MFHGGSKDIHDLVAACSRREQSVHPIWHGWTMAQNDSSTPRTLDPVIVEALMSITQVVHRRRDPRIEDKSRRYYSMLDRHSRDWAIATFNQLKHAGYDSPPFLIRRWVVANGWKESDAQLLDDYAAGVVAGVKYHHSDPIGRDGIDTWRQHAEGKEPWSDPGRPAQGVVFTRRD